MCRQKKKMFIMNIYHCRAVVASSPNAVLIGTNDASLLEVCLSPFAIVFLIVIQLAFERVPVQWNDHPNCVRHSNVLRTIVVHRKWLRNQATYKCHCHTMDARSPIPVTLMTPIIPVIYSNYHHPYRCNSLKIRYYYPDPISNRLS